MERKYSRLDRTEGGENYFRVWGEMREQRREGKKPTKCGIEQR